MSSPLDDDLQALLARRARVRDEDLAPLRSVIAGLPRHRRRAEAARGALAVAAGIIVVLGLGAVLVSRLPLGSSGAAPHAPDPAAFGGDPRLAACNATPDKAIAIFEMAHVRDYPLHLPGAYPLVGLAADPEAPALVIVLEGPPTGGRLGASPGPGNHDLCMVVGRAPDANGWATVAIVDVDTSGLVAFLPEPTGTPIADDLAAWVDRCGGAAAGILAVFRAEHGTDAFSQVVLLPEPPELATSDPVAIVVYDAAHPFAPLGTPPAPGATVEPREPLAEGHHDVCILVGSDAGAATRTIHDDLLVRFVVDAEPGATSVAGPTPDVAPAVSLPPQLASSACESMSFADDRCLAIVEAARQALAASSPGRSFDWDNIARVDLASITEFALGGRDIATVTFTLLDGTRHPHDVRCGIRSQYSLVCTDNPEILVTSPYGFGGGYTDTPCGPAPGGEPGSACATPLPTIEPEAARDAVPLEIALRDIPITSTGHLEIDLGRATLPNGVLSDARFALADPFIRAFTVDGGVRLEVRSLDPSRPPFENLYEHGWYPGVEDVEVYLVLDVVSFRPGATLQVRDLVVR